MRELQNTLAQLNENNFDILSNAGMNMIKGGTCNRYCSSPKSNKSNSSKSNSSSNKKRKPRRYNKCGW